MTFQDLTPYDINLIKSLASGLLVNTKINCRYEALSETVLGCIYAKGFIVHPYPDKLSLVISKAVQTKEHSAEQVIESIFKYLENNNLEIKKDESRTSTWSTPRPCWYTPYDPRKGSWQW